MAVLVDRVACTMAAVPTDPSAQARIEAELLRQREGGAEDLRRGQPMRLHLVAKVLEAGGDADGAA